jgi:radical SAM superfamily enzyme YgiQ (UPF0313 family)
MDRFGVRDFHIQDENFAVDRERVEKICRGLIDGGFGITFCFPSGLKMETLDRDLLELLARAGMRYFSLSPESGSRRVLALMNKTADIDRVPRARFRCVGPEGGHLLLLRGGNTRGKPTKTAGTPPLHSNAGRSGVDEVVMR